MQRHVSDWGGNIAAFAVTIAVNVLSNALPINGQSMAELSARYQSLFTPAGFTFSIWGVIYLLMLSFVIYQALPAQRDNGFIAGIGPYFRINCLANAAWLIAFHYEKIFVSLLIMLILLGTLVRIYRELLGNVDNVTRLQHVVLYLPFSVYTAWITVATVANLSAVQVAFDWEGLGMAPLQWTLLKLAIVAAVGAVMVIRLRDIPYGLVVAWAAFGVAAGQTATPTISGAATTVSLIALILVARDAWMKLRGI